MNPRARWSEKPSRDRRRQRLRLARRDPFLGVVTRRPSVRIWQSVLTCRIELQRRANASMTRFLNASQGAPKIEILFKANTGMKLSLDNRLVNG